MPLFAFDRQARREEQSVLCAGLDEVGRGPLAGPVVAAAVILDPSATIAGLMDSKKLTAKQRRELFFAIMCHSIDCGVGIVEPAVIDRINILQATKRAMIMALSDLSARPDLLMIDAVRLDGVEVPQRNIIRGDTMSACIAAASIVAKEVRDGIMRAEHARFPQYGFLSNMGYGTRHHLAALNRWGPCPIHRKTFGPVRMRPLF